MRTIYAILTGLMHIYALAHFIYTFSYTELKNTEALMWFFSGGIAMLFCAFINFIYLKEQTPVTRNVTMVSNCFMSVFLIILSVIIPEPQVLVLLVVMLVASGITVLISRKEVKQ